MRKVLLVDDSALIQKIVTLFFGQRNELKLVCLSSYQEAKIRLESGEIFFAAIVCIVLPDALNGEMADLSLHYKIPTLVLTSSIGHDIRAKMARKPIIDYVSKNTQSDILYAVELIHTLLYFEHEKVLIVSPNKNDLRSLQHYCLHLMMKPIHVSSMKDAMEIIAQKKEINFFIVDYGDSELDGLKLLQAIRNKYTREQKMVFILVDANMHDENALVLKYGANEIMTKPFSKEEFNARFFKELDLKKRLDDVKRINSTIERYVITSTTDENGIIQHVSQAFCDISGFTKGELIGQPQNIVRHSDMPSEVFKELWETIQSGRKWHGVVKNQKKDGGFYWVNAHIEPVVNSQGGITGYSAVRQDITAEKEVEEKNNLLAEAKQKITDSIRFSSLIQHALLPHPDEIRPYFSEHFVYWEPKDIVGGDIYQFLYRGDECLVFVIDCTGHGVPGAFMTMMVKSIVQSVVDEENFSNPAKILQEINGQIKQTLKQDNADSKNDAGFDGGVLHYDRATQKIRYAGAKTPLFYVQNGALNVYKGDRESIGYKKSNPNFEFTNFEIDVCGDTYCYVTTDGFIDQNGGSEGFPLGKKKFQKLIEDHYDKPFFEQETLFRRYLADHQGSCERDDDVTLFALKLCPESVQKGRMFYEYRGPLTQTILGEIVDGLEQNYESVFAKTRKKEKILIVLIELGQNIIKYGAPYSAGALEENPYLGLEYDLENDAFVIHSKNKIPGESMATIRARIDEANGCTAEEIKQKYQELRKNQKYAHQNGAGLGFFEFAKRSREKMVYGFEPMDEGHWYYSLKVFL